jgi:hypothetical protein
MVVNSEYARSDHDKELLRMSQIPATPHIFLVSFSRLSHSLSLFSVTNFWLRTHTHTHTHAHTHTHTHTHHTAIIKAAEGLVIHSQLRQGSTHSTKGKLQVNRSKCLRNCLLTSCHEPHEGLEVEICTAGWASQPPRSRCQGTGHRVLIARSNLHVRRWVGPLSGVVKELEVLLYVLLVLNVTHWKKMATKNNSNYHYYCFY